MHTRHTGGEGKRADTLVEPNALVLGALRGMSAAPWLPMREKPDGFCAAGTKSSVAIKLPENLPGVAPLKPSVQHPSRCAIKETKRDPLCLGRREVAHEE